MSKKQTRKSTSVNGPLYKFLQSYLNGRPLAEFVEVAILEKLGVTAAKVPGMTGGRNHPVRLSERAKLDLRRATAEMAAAQRRIDAARAKAEEDKKLTIAEENAILANPCRDEQCMRQGMHAAHDKPLPNQRSRRTAMQMFLDRATGPAHAPGHE